MDSIYVFPVCELIMSLLSHWIKHQHYERFKKKLSQSRFAHLLFLGLVTTVIFTHNLYNCSIFVVREPDSLSATPPPPLLASFLLLTPHSLNSSVLFSGSISSTSDCWWKQLWLHQGPLDYSLYYQVQYKLCFHPTEPHTHRQSELLHTDYPHEPPTLMLFQQDLLLAPKAVKNFFLKQQSGRYGHVYYILFTFFFNNFILPWWNVL